MGAPEQKAAAKPVLSGAKPELYKRSQKAKYQLGHEAELAALRQQGAELQLTEAETQEERAVLVQRSKSRQNKRSSDVLFLEDSKSPASRNREKPGAQRARLELSAKLKLKYCEEMLKKLFAHMSDFWSAQKKKYGLSKDQLQRILKQQGVLLLEAQNLETRKQKVLSKTEYKKKQARQLIQWLDAKFVSAELVSNRRPPFLRQRLKPDACSLGRSLTLWLAA